MNDNPLSKHSLQLIELTKQFVIRELEPHQAFKGALVLGSVAMGEARADSDVDCILLFDSVDERIVPAEFVWCPDGSINTIFDVEATAIGGVQIDAKRQSLQSFISEEWSEPLKHDLSNGIVIFDRNSEIKNMLEKKLQYTSWLQESRVLEHFGKASHQLSEPRIMDWIKRSGLLAAQDQISVAVEEIIKLLHAYNKIWIPWRYRWIISTLKLPWLPGHLSKTLEQIYDIELSKNNIKDRQELASKLLNDIEIKLIEERLLDLSEDAFERTHRELGYAHNMDKWKKAHSEFLKEH